MRKRHKPGSELDLRPDVDSLAVLHRIGQRIEPFAFLRIAHTRRHIEVGRKAETAPDAHGLCADRIEAFGRTSLRFPSSNSMRGCRRRTAVLSALGAKSNCDRSGIQRRNFR